MCTRNTMCTLLCAHTLCAHYYVLTCTLCTHTMMSHYYVHTHYVHTTMCTPTFHTWNAGPQKVSTLLYVEYGSVTKQGCYRTALRGRSKASNPNPPSPSMLLCKNILKSFFKHKAMAVLQVALILLRPLYELYPACTWSAFHSFGPRWATLPPRHIQARSVCEIYILGAEMGAWDNILRWCIKFREPTPAFMLCNSHKYRVSRDLRLCDALGTKSVLHTVLHPHKFIFLLTKSVRQKRHLTLPNAFLLARTNVLFCFAINWLTIVSLRNCLLINDFSCFSFKTLLKSQKIVLIKV